jgi:hypothetical protein
MERPVTSIQRFIGIQGNIFLVTIDKKEAFVYTVASNGDHQPKKDVKKIDFGDNLDSDSTICNTQVAFNGRFFAVGLVSSSKSLFGIFGFDRKTGEATALKWITKVSVLEISSFM